MLSRHARPLSLLMRSQLVLAALTPTAGAATLTVGASGDHATLAAAVAAASEGDVIELDSNTYGPETNLVTVGVSLTIRSTGGSSSTATLPPLEGANIDLVLEGVSVAVSDSSSGLVPGVGVANGSLTASDLRIDKGISTGLTYAISLKDSSATIDGLTADSVLSPLLLARSATYSPSRVVSVSSCTVTNVAPEGAEALFFLRSTAGLVDGCSFGDSSSSDAVVSSEQADLSVTNSSFSQITGGAVAMNVGPRGGRYRVADSTFTDVDTNISRVGGGSVRLMPFNYGDGFVSVGRSEFTLVDSAFSGGRGNSGPDLIVYQRNTGSTALIDHTTFTNSEGQIGGSAIIAGQATFVDSSFEDTRTPEGMGGALALFGETTIERCSFNNTSALFGGAVHAWSALSDIGDPEFPTSASVRIIDSTFNNTVAQDGGTIALEPGVDVWMSGGSITDPMAEGTGGAFYLYDPSGILERLGDPAQIRMLVEAHPLIIEDVAISGAMAKRGGVYGSVAPAEVRLLDSRIDDATAGDAGGVVYFERSGIAVLDGVDVSGITAGSGGVVSGEILEGEKRNAASAEVVEVYVVDTHVVGSEVSDAGGGFVLGEASTLEVMRSTFEDMQSDDVAGFLAASSPDSVRLQCTRVCASGSASGPLMALSHRREGLGATLDVSNSVFLNPTSGDGTIGVDGIPGTTLLRQNTFYGSAGKTTVSVGYKAGYNEVIGNIFVGQQLVLSSPNSSFTGSHNLWFDNLSEDGGLGVFPTASAVLGEPVFWDDPNSCSAELVLEDGSPGQDASVPGTFDVDGSPADIGALGGPDACFTDADGDGYTVLEDCDETDPLTNPGGYDVPYDGIDQDCSGEDACDLDGDGEQSTVCGGLDCNDADKAINSAATEVPYDGIDQDCTGSDACDLDGDGVLAIECGGTDCDDSDVLVYPGAEDLCYDGVDSDCALDDDYDCDGDGTIPDGYTDVYDGELPAGDCNDDDDTVFPGADDPNDDGIDSDCDGTIECDVDGDGYDNATCGGDDCNDEDAGINPGIDEIAYDTIDQDCDGADLCDVDGDGDDAETCGGDDCDDDNADVSSSADEVPYDTIDQDCDGADLCDVDGDGVDAEACGGDDCDDDEVSVFPGAEETPDDGIDQDCDGEDAIDGEQPPGESTSYVKGGCASVPATPGSGLGGLILLALAGLRRRKEA